MTQLPKLTRLTGFLGKDREIRTTRERTYTKTVRNDVIDGEEEIEVFVPSRSYLKLSLATHIPSSQGGFVTRWHDLIYWHPTPDAFLARKGDKIRALGYVETYELTTEQGETRTGVHFVVQSIRFLCRKIRHEVA
jgi:hypothetical protein